MHNTSERAGLNSWREKNILGLSDFIYYIITIVGSVSEEPTLADMADTAAVRFAVMASPSMI